VKAEGIKRKPLSKNLIVEQEKGEYFKAKIG